jgi:GTPase SAR1 family protein
MAVPLWLTTLAGWLTNTVGEKITTIAIDRVSERLKTIFATRNILILGDAQTGKTSLINYLTKGRPFNVRGGEAVAPDKTNAYVVVDKKVTLEDQKVKIKMDVAGEDDSAWKMALHTLKPSGVIYMLDGRLDNEELEDAVEKIFDEVLIHYAKGSLDGLEALHVFVNFCDAWSTTPVVERKKSRQIEEMFDAHLGEYANLENLRIRVAATQLSINKSSWTEVERALFSFGGDLL